MDSGHIAALALFVLLALNLFASLRVVRAEAFSARQRMLQLTTIWMVPILGAILCSLFIASASPSHSKASSVDPLYTPNDGGQPQEGIVGFGDFNGSGGAGDAGGGD